MKFKMLMAVLLLAGVAEGATLADIYRSVRGRSLYFDSVRVTNSLIRQFTNEEQENIAVLGSAVERETTFALSETGYRYALPADFYMAEALIINPNPAHGVGELPRPSALKFSPLKDYGRNPSLESGRPAQWSIFNGYLILDRVTQTELDTVTLYYFAHPAVLVDTVDTLELPEQYEPLLIDRVVLKCYERINFAPPDKADIQQNILYLEQKLLGRPVDER